jgi:acetyl esterase/lipase
MRLIRARAAEYGCNPAEVAALGFSAGGHLAASLTTNFGETVYEAQDIVDKEDTRPIASGLIYPVISMEAPVTHGQSAELLLGPNPSAELVAHRSPTSHVSVDTPPVFLMHALDDPAVPPQNSLMMMATLREAGRPVEAHFFEEGGHGFGLGAPDLPAHNWISLYEAWLDRHIRQSAK